MKTWTKEQYDERDRIMRESDLPLMGTKWGKDGWMGYVGSREMLADLWADDLYEHRKRMKQLTIDLGLVDNNYKKG